MNNKPKLIIITGQAGSGKTTLSTELEKLLHFPVVSRDRLKEGYVQTHGIASAELPEDTNKIVTTAFFDTVELLLSRNISIIIEAAFQHPVWESQMNKWTEIAEVTLVVCEVDPELAAKRHLERGLKDPMRTYFHTDNRVTHFKETGETLPPGEYNAPAFDIPAIRVATKDGYDPSLEEIKNRVQKF
ncbi:MAG TPA: AAA family ATPase [Patescibacteria group bacterium]|nr:AAA family ATPase [Patescibacteria group bacterium]|tara:strand:- start:36 stop:596 length:561 start_codon:yes stop_codon:yes gene_type:complete